VKPIPALEGLVAGLSLVAVGVLWTLANLGRLDLLATLRTFWPAVLVVWGLLELYNSRAAQLSSAPPQRSASLLESLGDGDTGRSE
jgi:hypothetical protein